MKYKAIFWDWNGTIIDDVHNALSCVNDMLIRKNKSTITLEQYYLYVETPIIGFYRHILPENELDFREISENYHKDYARHLPETALAEGSRELLQELKDCGVKQYIVSANQQDETEMLIKDYGLTVYFDKIVGAANHYADSKEQGARELFNSLSLKTDEVLFVGDTVHDFEVASAIGIKCILVSYGHQGRRLLSRCGGEIVDSIKEVRDIIFSE